LRCTSCDAEAQAGARFCPQCAAPLPSESALAQDPLRAALEAAIGFQYRIERLLGKGGMGAVYLAHELALDREVAIKVLPPERGESREGLERFRREARTAARLNHSHVVPLYTFGEVRGIVYYVMGYVRGEPLSARLRRAGRLGAEESRRILGELADALDYAHRQGVVHRDLKPDNVLLEEDSGRALLADFGIAKSAGVGSTLTATGSIVGTPLYMSPEQASGKDVDGRSDLYSLGVIGYEMLAGRRPFDAPTPADVLVQHMTKEPPPLQPLAAGAPDTLLKAVTRCLSKDPAARWPDAKALRQSLLPSEEDTELPRDLQAISVSAQVSVFALLAAAYIVLYWWASAEYKPGGFTEVFVRVTPIMIALLGAAQLVTARQRGHSAAESLRAAVSQPPWWVGWYPRRWRRPLDVWDRLPAGVRRYRTIALSMALYCALFAVPTTIVNSAVDQAYVRTGRRQPLRAAVHREARRLPEVHSLLVLASCAGLIAQYAVFRSRLRRSGLLLDDYELQRVLSASTSNHRFWSRPAVAALLLPEGATGAASKQPMSAEEIERALRELPQRVPESERGLAERARSAALQARQALHSLDAELQALEREYDAPEAKRLEEKLAALGEPRGEEPSERRQMRELIEKQAALLRGVAARLDSGRRERSRRLQQLEALWLQADALRSPASARNPESVARLHTLCAEMESGGFAALETMPQSRASAPSDAETLGR
jgi:predicted Ser/Thr protein kinase